MDEEPPRYYWKNTNIDMLSMEQLKIALKEAIDVIDSELRARWYWQQFQGHVYKTNTETFNGN